MNKQEFLAQLRKRLHGLPREDMEERLSFYSEMIDDRVEEGRTEEEAVSDIGTADEISAQIIAETPLAKIIRERVKPKRRLKAWEIVLLALGSPIWLSLGIAAVAVILAVYVSLWAVIVSLWAIFVSLVAFAMVSIPVCIISITGGSGASGFAMLAAGIVCAGLSVFMFCGSRRASKEILILTKKITTGTKNSFIKKENVQ